MVIHKRTKLTPLQRSQLSDDYWKKHMRICDLKRKYQITAPTVYKIIHRGKHKDYSIHKSINKRFRCLKYGIRRLEKIKESIENKLKEKSRRYNKKYPGEMFHLDTKRLPLLKKENTKNNRVIR